MQIVKVFNNVFDALNYAREVEKAKKVLGEPRVYAKYKGRKCTASVVFNVK